jgi:hypothetical protein
LVTLAGTTRPEVTPANDRGPVSDTLQLNHMYLLLNRSAAQESAAEQLVEELHDNASPLYHQWLTADQIAAQFGPSADDVSKVTNWLVSHGFTIHTTYAADGVIDFSGPASAIAPFLKSEWHEVYDTWYFDDKSWHTLIACMRHSDNVSPLKLSCVHYFVVPELKAVAYGRYMAMADVTDWKCIESEFRKQALSFLVTARAP